MEIKREVDGHEDQDGEDHGVVADQGTDLKTLMIMKHQFLKFITMYSYLCGKVWREFELLQRVCEEEGSREENHGEEEDVGHVRAGVANQRTVKSEILRLQN